MLGINGIWAGGDHLLLCRKASSGRSLNVVELFEKRRVQRTCSKRNPEKKEEHKRVFFMISLGIRIIAL